MQLVRRQILFQTNIYSHQNKHEKQHSRTKWYNFYFREQNVDFALICNWNMLHSCPSEKCMHILFQRIIHCLVSKGKKVIGALLLMEMSFEENFVFRVLFLVLLFILNLEKKGFSNTSPHFLINNLPSHLRMSNLIINWNSDSLFYFNALLFNLRNISYDPLRDINKRCNFMTKNLIQKMHQLLYS